MRAESAVIYDPGIKLKGMNALAIARVIKHEKNSHAV